MIESRCGILCSQCHYKEQVGCKGCVNIDKPFWGDACPVKSCCEGKGEEHCGGCLDFACKQLNDFAYDKEQGDNGKRIEQCKKWNIRKMVNESEHTNDLLYSYKRKTEIDAETLKFTFEFDLKQEITQPDLADMVMYCCQRDLLMQEIVLQHGKQAPAKSHEYTLLGEEKQFDFDIPDILSIANEYRLAVLKRAESKQKNQGK